MGAGSILAIFMLVAVVAIGVTFAPSVFGAAEQGHNMTGTQYESIYTSGQQIIILGLTLTQFVVIILIMFAIIASLLLIKVR